MESILIIAFLRPEPVILSTVIARRFKASIYLELPPWDETA